MFINASQFSRLNNMAGRFKSLDMDWRRLGDMQRDSIIFVRNANLSSTGHLTKSRKRRKLGMLTVLGTWNDYSKHR